MPEPYAETGQADADDDGGEPHFLPSTTPLIQIQTQLRGLPTQQDIITSTDTIISHIAAWKRCYQAQLVPCDADPSRIMDEQNQRSVLV